LRWFHLSALHECFAVGGALTLTNGGPEAGAIALMPKGAWPRPLLSTLRAVALPRAFPTARLVRAGLHIESKIRSLHPPAPHVYVYLLGVHPARKGQGLGATLLRHARHMSEQAGCVTHLETSNPVNLPFYRRFGFEIATEITSHGGPPLWTMTTPNA
jgi:ribosomal protein S18 acetylase RimI-like enzyme